MEATKMVKVSFPVEQTDGYPPVSWEHLWAKEIEAGKFQIDNIPFYFKGVSLGDVVLAGWKNKTNVYEEVYSRSGHSTIRIVVFDEDKIIEIRSKLKVLGCHSELMASNSLIGVDVPTMNDYGKVLAYLEDGYNSGLFDYEEACVWW